MEWTESLSRVLAANAAPFNRDAGLEVVRVADGSVQIRIAAPGTGTGIQPAQGRPGAVAGVLHAACVLAATSAGMDAESTHFLVEHHDLVPLGTLRIDARLVATGAEMGAEARLVSDGAGSQHLLAVGRMRFSAQ